MRQMLSLLLALVMLVGYQGGETPSGTEAEPVRGNADVGVMTNVTTLEPGKLHVSTNAEFPPYVMKDGAGNYIGIDIEVAAAIAEKLGLELVVENMSFDAALMAVPAGQSDITITGITATDDRLEIMDFSDPYVRNLQVVIVKENSGIVTLDDLYDVDFIGTQRDTTGYIYASDIPENYGYGEDHVLAYDTGALAVQALLNGQIDAVIIDNGPAQAFVAANPGLTILDTFYADEDYAVGVQRGNAQLLNAVNRAIAELREDGTLQAIFDKYIKAE